MHFINIGIVKGRWYKIECNDSNMNIIFQKSRLHSKLILQCFAFARQLSILIKIINNIRKNTRPNSVYIAGYNKLNMAIDNIINNKLIMFSRTTLKVFDTHTTHTCMCRGVKIKSA